MRAVRRPRQRLRRFEGSGGGGDYYLCPESGAEICRIRKSAERKLPWFILGNGSNLLVSDRGYRGAVIQIYKNLCGCGVEGCCLRGWRNPSVEGGGGGRLKTG